MMEPYIQKCKGVLLGQMMEHLGITIADLPKLPGKLALCYNYVLGRCILILCQNKEGHIDVSKVANNFAIALLDKICPAVQHFFSQGPPPLVYQNQRHWWEWQRGMPKGKCIHVSLSMQNITINLTLQKHLFLSCKTYLSSLRWLTR